MYRVLAGGGLSLSMPRLPIDAWAAVFGADRPDVGCGHGVGRFSQELIPLSQSGLFSSKKLPN